MKTLFLSFSSLIRLVMDGKVTQEELDNGLYYFGCTRVYVFNPIYLRCRSEEKDNHERALKVVQEAIIKAEHEGRTTFRELGNFNTHAQLCKLLKDNNVGYTFQAVMDLFSHTVNVKF